ncbi:hypothetical protein ABG067_009360, partial [Albugo candida]
MPAQPRAVRTPGHHRVDQQLHRMDAVAHHIVTMDGMLGSGLAEQEVVHPADMRDRIEQARGDARSQQRGDHDVGLGDHGVLALNDRQAPHGSGQLTEDALDLLLQRGR